MHVRTILLPAVVLTLGACNASVEGARTSSGFIERLPDAVVAAAAPYQDLRHVRLLPEDGCYWYRHEGPVETTLLPLRTAEGRPICTRAQRRPVAGG
ncbi:hypothetical protein [Rhodovulum euryhalinum]|uniref:Lipoprotein n=1 Tax=Rhodovulum euryhalinum TaxID=35805 RepID=A0A4R2KI26_9RHOB|nr:hypothetical protein [Rhodovulum euryhalinum]TCO73273.1 hypothetical protein EV655_10237 [Rhodovulum euryhalinum]